MRKLKWTLVVFLAFTQLIQAMDVQEAWQLFFNNEYETAKKEFTTLSNNEKTKSESLLALSLIAQAQRQPEQANAIFNRFCNLDANYESYLRALWSTESVNGSFGRKKDAELKFLKEILGKEDLHSTTKTLILEILGNHYETINELEKAKSYHQKIGAIHQWSLAGTFENISTSGYDKAYPPIDQPQNSARFEDKNKGIVQWFPVSRYNPGQWIDFTYHFVNENSIIYAQSFWKSEVEQDLTLRVGTSGSLKAWVNDNLIMEEQEERNNNLDTYSQKIHLKKGWNRVLLQIGRSYLDRSNFLVRLTDAKGENAQNVSYDAQYHPYIKDKNLVKIGYEESFHESYFKSKVQYSSEKPINFLLLGMAYLGNGKIQLAKEVLHQAERLSPNSAFIKEKLIELYLREGDNTSVSSLQEEVKQLEPDGYLSLQMQYNDAMVAADFIEASAIIDKIEMIEGKTESIAILRSTVLAKENKILQLVEDVQKYRNEYPHSYYFTNLGYLIEKDMNKDGTAAAAILENYLKNNNNDSFKSILSDLYLSISQKEKGIALLEDMIANKPQAVGYIRKLGELYLNSGEREEAIKRFDQCLVIAPYIGYTHKVKGQALEDLGMTKEAIDAYNHSIEYAPNDFQTYRKLRKLQGKSDIDGLYKMSDPSSLTKVELNASDYPESNSIIVLNEVLNTIYPSGGSVEKYAVMVKIFTQQGIDAWKEYTVDYTGADNLVIEKAEVIKKNGEKIQADVNQNQIVFKSLEPDDYIWLNYRLESYRSGQLSQHFWGQHYFDLYYPVVHSKYNLLVPKDFKFNYVVTNSDLKPTISAKEDYQLYTWSKDNIEKINYEDLMPALPDVASVLNFSSLPDWDFVSEWYHDLAYSKANTDKEVKDLVADLFAKHHPTTEKEKAIVIYNFIVNSINYSYVTFRQTGLVPQKAKDVLNTKVGDCKDVSTLFVSMCDVAGLDAELVLVSTRDRGKHPMALPSIDFNHCIAKLNLDNKEYYTELTSPNLSFTTHDMNLRDAFVLNISKDKSKKDEPFSLQNPNRVINSVSRKSTMEVKGDSLEVKTENYKTGTYASNMRYIYRNQGVKTQRENLISALSNDKNSVKLLDFNFYEGLDNNDEAITYDYTYQLPDQISDISGFKLLQVPLADPLSPLDFLNSNERNYPIELCWLEWIDEVEETITLQLPKGMDFMGLPENKVIQNDFATYNLSFKADGNHLLIQRKLKYQKNSVNVPTEYDQFKTFYQNVAKADKIQIAFK